MMSASIGGILGPAALRIARSAAYKASKVIKTKFANATRPVNAALEPVFVRSGPHSRQPIHPAAFLRQQKSGSGRWHSTSSKTYQNINAAVRRFLSTGRVEGSGASRIDRSKSLNSSTGRAISQFTGRAPFASTLRPNLTGGALPRTAGGYGLGSGRVGGARYFSHAPAAQAQVVQNVSSAVRAFWISGQKAQFDGLTTRGEKRYRAVSALQEETTRKMAAVPRHAAGSHVDFRLNPIVTALSPLTAAFPYPLAGVKTPAHLDATTLNTEGFLDVLSVDFARALKDLTTTLADIKKLSSLGDLPVQLQDKGHTLRIRFPGVDAETVESLCDDLGLTRGTVREDADFNAQTGASVALRFPYAPDAHVVRDNQTVYKTPARALISPAGSLRSEDSYLPSDEDDHELFFVEDGLSDVEEYNPWLESSGSDLEGYETMSPSPPISPGELHNSSSAEYEGLESIYKFLEECDRARGRV